MIITNACPMANNKGMGLVPANTYILRIPLNCVRPCLKSVSFLSVVVVCHCVYHKPYPFR